MDAATTRHYVRMAEARARGPQTYGGPVSASVRCYVPAHRAHRAYARNVDGELVGLGVKGGRLLAIAQRLAASDDGRTSTQAMADEARVSRGYVSKVLARLRDRRLIGFGSSRGRFGSLLFWALRGLRRNVSSNVTTLSKGESLPSTYRLDVQGNIAADDPPETPQPVLAALWVEIGW